MELLRKIHSMAIWKQIMIGMFLGVLLGPFLTPMIGAIDILGKAFIALIKMVVLPLILLSIVTGIAAVGNIKNMGRIGAKTLFFYLFTTTLAIPIGLFIALTLEPGVGLNFALPANSAELNTQSPSITLLSFIPSNPFSAFASGNTIQVIVFSVFLGLAITALGEKSQPFLKVLTSASEIINKLIEMIIRLAPLGVFALIAVVTNRFGLDVLLPLTKLIVAVYLGCILHTFIVLGSMIRLMTGLSFLTFLKGIFEAQIMAFSTTSAAATLPVTMRCSEQNHGVNKEVSRFVLPVGATINMDGTALYQALSAVFIAQAYAIDLGIAELLTIMFTTIVASIGTAAVPAAGLVVLSVVLASVGLPLEGIALIAGIDRILDMARSTVNITGDATVALLVASSEKSLDRQIFYYKVE
jgi:Na+/H+-dicarboxylate symporter